MVDIDDHERRGHWMLMNRSDMLQGHKTILSVWIFVTFMKSEINFPKCSPIFEFIAIMTKLACFEL